MRGITADFTGQEVGVLDGNTIDIRHNDRSERVRLNGIDTPEKGQDSAGAQRNSLRILRHSAWVGMDSVTEGREGVVNDRSREPSA